MITIDDREKSALKEYVISEATRLNMPYKIERLKVGDYVHGECCFEAKSTHDFLASAISGRIWNQIDNMDRNYQNNVVIIYGEMKDALTYTQHSFSKMPERNRQIMLRTKFYGAMGAMVLDYDVKPFWVPNVEEAARIITSICKMSKVERVIKSPKIIKTLTSTDMRIDILSTIKGVSPAKAKLLLETFGSIMEIGEATTEEIASLPKFGNTVAKRIIEALNTEEKVRI